MHSYWNFQLRNPNLESKFGSQSRLPIAMSQLHVPIVGPNYRSQFQILLISTRKSDPPIAINMIYILLYMKEKSRWDISNRTGSDLWVIGHRACWFYVLYAKIVAECGCFVPIVVQWWRQRGLSNLTICKSVNYPKWDSSQMATHWTWSGIPA